MSGSVPRLRSPEALATLIAVNITPIAGIFFLGWPPSGVLITYFFDTYIGFCSVVILMMIHVTGDEQDTPIEGWKRWSKLVAAFVLLAAIFVLPVALPILVVLGMNEIVRTILEERGFMLGMSAQVLMSALASMQLHRELQRTHEDDRILSTRLLFLAARWLAVFLVVGIGIPNWLGPRWGSFLLVAIYAGASIYFELYPEHAIRFVRHKSLGQIKYGADIDARAGIDRKDDPAKR